jgi:hypothetical protein
VAETVDLSRIAAQSCKQEALFRGVNVFLLFCREIRFTVLLTLRQANETRRAPAQRRGKHDGRVLEGG